MLFRVNLLKRHSFAISPPDAPQGFFWTIAKPGQEAVPTAMDEWTESTDAAYREGQLAARRGAGVRRARRVRYRTRPFLVVARRRPHRLPADRAGGAVRVPGGARLRRTGAGCSDRARVRPGKLRVAGQQRDNEAGYSGDQAVRPRDCACRVACRS